MKARRTFALSLSLIMLAAAAALPSAAQNRSPRRAAKPTSPVVTLGPGQKARLVVGVWDLDNDGAFSADDGGGEMHSKVGVPLTLKFRLYAPAGSEGGVVRRKLVGERSSGQVVVPVNSIVSYEWDFNFWDLDNDGVADWDINNDGALSAAVEGAQMFNDKGTHDTGIYLVYINNRAYRLSVGLEVADAATGKIVLRLGGQDFE
jgi:hypothetical protein